MCDTVTIPASACTQQICAHTLKINPSSPCLFSSGGVSITVFATNVLGKGPMSDPVVFVIPECNGNHDKQLLQNACTTLYYFNIQFLQVTMVTVTVVQEWL